MAEEYSEAVRTALLETLMEKVESDPYPSATMLDQIESLLHPEDVPAYADLLLSRVRGDRFPSISLIYRLEALT